MRPGNIFPICKCFQMRLSALFCAIGNLCRGSIKAWRLRGGQKKDFHTLSLTNNVSKIINQVSCKLEILHASSRNYFLSIGSSLIPLVIHEDPLEIHTFTHGEFFSPPSIRPSVRPYIRTSIPPQTLALPKGS